MTRPTTREEPTQGWALVHVDGVIVAADAGFASLVGVDSPADLVGESLQDLLSPEGQQALGAIERSARYGLVWSGTLEVRAGGAALQVDASSAERAIALHVTGVAQPTSETASPSMAPGAAESTLAPTSRTASTPSVRSGLRADLERATAQLGADWTALLLASAGGRTLTLEACLPEPIAGVGPGASWSPPDHAERMVIETGEPGFDGALAVRRGDASPLTRLPAYGMRSALRVPLFHGTELVGLVAAYAKRPDAFSLEDALRFERSVRPLGAALAGEPHPGIVATPAVEEPSRSDSTAPREPFDRLGTLSEVMSGIAHELNNPLTAVVGYAQALRSLPPADQQHALAIIETEALRAGRIVSDLLTFAQAQPLDVGPVDLSSVVRRVLDLKRDALRLDGIAIDSELTQRPGLRGDARKLEQAFLQLVDNAQRAMAGTGGVLRVRTSAERQRARVVVEDTGPGVPPELRSRVFDPFFSARGIGGAGLGLAVVSGTVASHGGRVWVEAASAGGTRFVVELPLDPTDAATEDTSTLVPTTDERPTAARRVLVVDDEESIRALATQVLATFGYEAVAVASAEAALDLLEAQPIDAILTDVRMPGMDGLALYREVARRWPALASRVVIMTGDVENEAVAGLVREAQLPALEKPFRLDALRAALEQALGDAPG